MEQTRVLSVGQCGFDHGSISNWLKKTFGAETLAAGTQTQALKALASGRFDLVLVNRIGDADGLPGHDLIRAIKGDPNLSGIKVMMVSNFEAAQKQAIDLGALPGFGKSDLGTKLAVDRVRAAMTEDATSAGPAST